MKQSHLINELIMLVAWLFIFIGVWSFLDNLEVTKSNLNNLIFIVIGVVIFIWSISRNIPDTKGSTKKLSKKNN